jgi:hypothetical protein
LVTIENSFMVDRHLQFLSPYTSILQTRLPHDLLGIFVARAATLPVYMGAMASHLLLS